MDHEKNADEKFKDWVRKELIETKQVITNIAIEFDRQIQAIRGEQVIPKRSVSKRKKTI